MNVINLPSEEDAQVTVNLGGKSYLLNLFECEECLVDTRKRLQETGVTDTATYMEIFRDECKTKLGLPLEPTAANIFFYQLTECLEEFKKKFEILQVSQDITEESELPTPDSSLGV